MSWNSKQQKTVNRFQVQQKVQQNKSLAILEDSFKLKQSTICPPQIANLSTIWAEKPPLKIQLIYLT
jgi:hypothetical protein